MMEWNSWRVSQLKFMTGVSHHANDHTNHQQNTAEMLKFCGSAQNTTARRKMWALAIMKNIASAVTEVSYTDSKDCLTVTIDKKPSSR